MGHFAGMKLVSWQRSEVVLRYGSLNIPGWPRVDVTCRELSADWILLAVCTHVAFTAQ